MKRKKENGMIFSAALGVAFSLAVTLLGAALSAWMIGSGMVTEQRTGLLAGVVTVLSAAAGSVLASARLGKNRVQVGLIVAGGYLLLLLAMAVLLFDGEFYAVPLGIALVAVGAFASMLPAFLAGKGRAVRKTKRRYR